MKNPTIIFRTINACNLNCKYCYDKKNHYNIKKENEKFQKKIKEIIENVDKLLTNKECKSEFIFHGGEPLLIEPEKYARLIDGIKINNPNIRFSLQTNGTLISKDFIKIFKKYNIHIGISLDGYNEEQNKYRVDNNGKSTFLRIMKSIKLLQNNDVNFGVIMSISKQSIGHEKDLYEFICDNKLKCNIRPIFGERDIMLTNEEYYTFFTNLFNIWFEDESSKASLRQITEIYNIFKRTLDKNYKSKLCSHTCNCFNNFLSLDVDGQVYSCNRTYNNSEFYYGNINDMDVKILTEKMQLKAEQRIDAIKNSKCNKCVIYEYCKGGCPANAFEKYKSINGIDDYYCKARIMINKYVYRKLKDNGIIDKYKERKLEKNENNYNFV